MSSAIITIEPWTHTFFSNRPTVWASVQLLPPLFPFPSFSLAISRRPPPPPPRTLPSLALALALSLPAVSFSSCPPSTQLCEEGPNGPRKRLGPSGGRGEAGSTAMFRASCRAVDGIGVPHRTLIKWQPQWLTHRQLLSFSFPTSCSCWLPLLQRSFMSHKN